MVLVPGDVSGLTPGAAEAHAWPHIVQFYDSSDALCAAVADFLAAGAAAGEPLIVIATEPHRRALAEALAARGAAAADLTLLDAEQTLARFMVGCEPDRARFEDVIGGAIRELAERRPGVPVRAYGEMVDVLWRGDNRTGALRLEALWNQLQERESFSLYCAYVMGSFYKEGDIRAICGAHSHVVPSARDAAPPQAASGVLLAEIAERVRVEDALRISLRDLERAREEIARGRQHLQQFIDEAPVGIHWVAPDGTILWANHAELEMLGYESAEYVGRHIAEFHADRDVIDDMLARLSRGETLVDREARMRAKDGAIRHVLVNSNVHSVDGRFVHTRCFTRDVTEERAAISQRTRDEAARAAAAAQRQRLLAITAAIAEAVSREEVFEAVVDEACAALGASSAGLFLLDGDTVRLVRAVGYNPDAVPRMDGLAVTGPLRIPSLDVIRDGEPLWIDSQRELLLAYPHLGSSVTPTRSYRIACLPIQSQDGTLGSLAFTFDDAPAIDDNQKSFLLLIARYCGQALERLRLLEAEKRSRTQAEEARVRAELLHQLARAIILAQRAEDVFDAALGTIGRALATERSAVLLYDDGGVMRFVAQRGLSERYRRAVEGHSPWRPDEIDPHPVLVADVTADPELAAFQGLFESEGIGALAFFPLVAGGRLLGKFMVYHDRARPFPPQEVDLAMAIANHVGAAVVRFQAVAELERTVRFNELFTGILGHDLRNPLHAIITAANVALLRGEGDRQLKPITRILSSGERMSRMIDQLLDFTRVRTGAGIPIDVRPVDLAVLVRQVADELEDAHPEWTFALDAAGNTIGSWDPDRLAQVFSNLFGNAVQHGLVAAGVRIRIDGSDAERVLVEVHNQGTIPRELLPRVFEPMSGGDTRRARSQGLGLGLFISEQIARAHGGAVSVASTDEAGTTFTVSLPRDGGTR